MNLRCFALLLLMVVSSAALATTGFTPPSGDYSVLFLGNIFGVVDGVLNGTGSQIVGTMFGVFNAAVLAVGGIIIMYTLIVATMNTAHEGKFLGQKWNSIWIPVRTTIGLGLLIPKASGYCMMQIFVMWVVVQGIGAADKIWDAALQYLNRGGVIVAQQLSTSVDENRSTATIATGAMSILAGQVCMMGLQKILQDTQKNAQSSTTSTGGPCYGTPINDGIKTICNTTVPDFVGSVNFTEYQQQKMPTACGKSDSPSTKALYMPMPNFNPTTQSDYARLNGICGYVSWSPLSSSDVSTVKSIDGLTCADLDTTIFSRAIAIQQMYSDLQSVANQIVNNNPQIVPLQGTPDTKNYFSAVAVNQFGVPMTSNGQVCQDSSDCIGWGPDPSKAIPVMFSGTEFNAAILDYDGVMMPTLNLISAQNSGSNADKAKSFISDAEQQGWLMAGAYFFNLVILNGNAAATGMQVDDHSGLQNSSPPCTDIQAASFGSGSNNVSYTCKNLSSCSKPKDAEDGYDNYALLCQMMNQQPGAVKSINGMINGLGVLTTPLSPPDFKNGVTLQKNTPSSMVYGLTGNQSMVNIPGQPGQSAPKFVFTYTPKFDTSMVNLPDLSFPPGFMGIPGMIGDILYNYIIKDLILTILTAIAMIVGQIIQLVLITPLMLFANIVTASLAFVNEPGVNPIVGLANMGTHLINYAFDWFVTSFLGAIILAVSFPIEGAVIILLVMAIAPLPLSLLVMFITIGFLTAFYIPFVPYMMFVMGVLAWMISVIEAMVAAPLGALGITFPDGQHELLGKAEPGLMILLNVFLRPTLMVFGFIMGISLSYVGVWILNAGYNQASAFFQGQQGIDYTNISAMLTIFFSMLVYTTFYITLVEKSFTLIYILPDGVLSWLGHKEGAGERAAGWAQQEIKGQVQSMGKGVIDSTSTAEGTGLGKLSKAASDEGKRRATAKALPAGQDSNVG